MKRATTLESGHTFEDVTGQEMERLKKKFAYFADGAIKLQPGNWIFPQTYLKYSKQIYNYKAKSSDIFVVAMPKSGTNWLQEIVWNLVANPNLDKPEADMTIDARCPFFEIDFFFDVTGISKIRNDGEIIKRFKQLCPDKDPSEGVFINLSTSIPDPRLIKSHLPCPLLPLDILKTSKVLYMARDPRDVMISFYHFSKLHTMANFKGTMEDYIEEYINDLIPYQPYWQHVQLAWEKRNDPNFLFLYYEDLKADPKSEIRRIDKFIGTNRTDKQIDDIIDYTEFSNMKERTKNNPPTSFDKSSFDKEEKEGASYYRKGRVGSWKDDFTPELEEKVNAWMRKNLVNFGDDFKYKF